MNAKRTASEEVFDLNAWEIWRARNEKGEGSIYQTYQPLHKRKLDKTFKNKRIEVLTCFDVEQPDGTITHQLRGCGGVVKKISDGTWLYPNARSKRYNIIEAAYIFWDAVPECDLEAGQNCIISLIRVEG